MKSMEVPQRVEYNSTRRTDVTKPKIAFRTFERKIVMKMYGQIRERDS